MQTSIPDHVLVFDARGTLEKSDIERFDQQIQEKLARYERIGLVANVEELEGMTVGAVMKDIAAEMKYLGDWHRFPKLAVLASGGFVKSAAETVGKLLPQVQVRTFNPGELESAIEFAGAVVAGETGQASASAK
jgi:hypothetical protein